jgi:hypothetical protein
MYVYVACVPECDIWYIWYTTYSICISSNSDESKKLPDDGRPLPKRVGACISIKEWYNSVHVLVVFAIFTIILRQFQDHRKYQ